MEQVLDVVKEEEIVELTLQDLEQIGGGAVVLSL